MQRDDSLPPHVLDAAAIADDDTDAVPVLDDNKAGVEDWVDVTAEVDATLTDIVPAPPPKTTAPVRSMPGLPVPVSAGHFAVLTGSEEEVEERLAANGALRTSDLDRITVPSGGGLAWMVPTINGAAMPMPSLEGIIAAWADRRAYWPRPVSEGAGSPPDCSSKDGLRGEGTPGGECARCPHAQFGSASSGRGQACRLTRELLFFLPDHFLPFVVIVPPSSHAEVARFIRRLPVPSYSAVVRLALEQERSESRILYSVVRPQFVAPLEAASRERFAVLHRQLAAVA
jgi:hypothetical protein